MTNPLTLDQAAARIGMSTSKVVRLCKAGELKHTQVFGGCYAIDPASLEAWASANIAPDGWLTSTEAAKIIGCHGTNVSRYIEQGKLEARRYGAKRYVHEDAVRQFAASYKASTVGERRAAGGRNTAAKVKGANWATITAKAEAKSKPKRKPAAPVVKWANIDDMVRACHTAVRVNAMGEVIEKVQRAGR